EDLSARCFVSGLSQDASEAVITSGGRVLLASGHGETIKDAVDAAYDCVDQIEYATDTLFYRKDIGFRAMQSKVEGHPQIMRVSFVWLQELAGVTSTC